MKSLFRLKVFIITLILLSSGILYKVKAEETDVNILLVTTLDVTGQAGQNALVKMTAADLNITPSVFELDLDANGMSYFELTYQDTQADRFNLSINRTGENVSLQWNQIAGAVKYYIYGSVNPLDPYFLLDSTTATDWTGNFSQSKFFYKVAVYPAQYFAKFDFEITPYPTSNIEKTSFDEILVPIDGETYVFEKVLEKIRQQKRVMGTIRNLENLTGVENAKVLVSKMMPDGGRVNNFV